MHDKSAAYMPQIMHGDHPHVTKEVYCQCISEIKNWIDIGATQTQLMTQGVIITPDDLYNIT